MIIVTAAVIERYGKILIARRPPEDRLSGKWEFPGGKIEEGETPEQALNRELREEFMVETEVGEFLLANEHQYENFRIRLMSYRVSLISDPSSIQLTAHDKIAWAGPKDFQEYEFAPADLPIVELLSNDN